MHIRLTLIFVIDIAELVRTCAQTFEELLKNFAGRHLISIFDTRN